MNILCCPGCYEYLVLSFMNILYCPGRYEYLVFPRCYEYLVFPGSYESCVVLDVMNILCVKMNIFLVET